MLKFGSFVAHKKRGNHVTSRNEFLVALAAASLSVLIGCATEPEKPAPPPAPAPAPKPVAQPEPPKKPSVITVTSTELFEFNKAVLTNEAKAKLDKEVVARAKDFSSVSLVHVDGHADRLGAAQYNQRLSEKRADAVRAYLVSKGFDGSKIETLGSGKTNPVKGCPDQKDRKALVECLTPNRRVVVEMKGMPR